MAREREHIDLLPASDSAEDAVLRDTTPPGGSSDGEGGERTAREKLKKTSIAGLAQYSRSNPGGGRVDHPLSESISADVVQEHSNGNNSHRGRPSKKRSFEDLQDDQNALTENGSIGPPNPKSGHHKRMRSRDISNGDIVPGFGKVDELASPVQEESDDEAQQSPGGPGVLVDAPSREQVLPADQSTEDVLLHDGDDDATGERTPKESAATVALPSTAALTSDKPPDALQSPQDATQKPASSTTKISPDSGFANTSTASPFGSVKPAPSKARPAESTSSTTSSSAFASSGLSAFASSEKSPFAAGASVKSPGGFGGGSTGFGGGGGFGSTTTSGFGGASPFVAKSPPPFGTTGGFGSSAGFGRGFATKPLGESTGFPASAGGAGAFGKSKPFGAPKDEEEGTQWVEEGNEIPKTAEKVLQDDRFTEQDLETGEEEEETVFSCRAKLYHFEKEWKERGVGTFKINIRYEEKAIVEGGTGKDPENEEDPEAGKFSTMERKARLIMRTDGVHRVVLNSPVFKEMNVGTQDGKEPTGRTMFLTGLEDGKPRGFQIKIGKEEVLKDLYHKIQDIKAEL